MKPVSITTLLKHKQNQEKFSVVAAYDASFAKAIEQAGVEAILIGDSLGMVLQGHDSTIPVSIDDMAYHTACVKRGTERSWLIADMPFGTYTNPQQALDNAAYLMQSGAHMVKMEGGQWLLETIETLTQRSIPVCAHLGLTPQSVNVIGGYKVQGREDSTFAAEQLLEDAKAVEAAGATLLVLECIPSKLAASITQALSIPVIGIGAGSDTDAQVLVLHDLLGLGEKLPSFVHNFLADTNSIQSALSAYNEAVKSGEFPTQAHSFN